MSAVDSKPHSRSPSHGHQPSAYDAATALDHFASSHSNAMLDYSYGMPQPNITFSAEPDAIADFTSYPGLSPADGYDADTSTAAGSYSSMHPPNSVAGSYPYQQNGYLHHQNVLHANNVLSPLAQSNQDQFGSEGYVSEPAYPEYSRFASPNMDDQVLGDQYSMLSLHENNSSAHFPGSYGAQNMDPTGFGTNGVSNFVAPNTQRPPSSHPNTQLISPSVTTNSSPVIKDEFFQSRIRVSDVEPFPKITTSLIEHAGSQFSPDLSEDPSQTTHFNQPATLSHLTSPIDIRVENYSPDGPAEPVSANLASRKRSLGGKRSHLSPYDAQDPSDDGEEASEDELATTEAAPSLPAQERNEDGSWVTRPDGQAGVSPSERQRLNEVEVPSLLEQEDAMRKAEKQADVEDWLSHSDVGSEAEINPNKSRRKKSMSRRRAKSFNDMQPRLDTGLALGLGVRTDYFDDSRIPGPGVYVDERSELDEDEDDGISSASDSESIEEPQSPPADIVATNFTNAPVGFPFETSDVNQAPTANAAIMRFVLRARENDTASITATLGSRRLSESDLGSLFAARGISKLVKEKPKEKRERRPSFLQQIIPKRSNSNLKKRKGSVPTSQAYEPGQASPKEASSTATPKRTSSWGIVLARADTNLSASSKDGASTGAARGSAPSGPFSGLTKAIQRHRSRSDLGKSAKSPGLAQLMTQHGGPPMPYLASPSVGPDSKQRSPPTPSPLTAKDDSDADDMMSQEAIIMDLKVRSDPIIPSYEGFRTHARQLNPRLVDYMVERVTQEQMRRYKRLLEYRVKHANAVSNKHCSAGKFCLALGGESLILPPRAANKDGETPFIGFQVTAPGSSDEENEALSEGTVVAAQFPPGVPLPPVKRLPAEFECPLCFKVKKFQKPSDWTKHVHEDVQPFTCTFPNCGEPKSFKRKADWVRHENERHRQLENWTCNIGDCTHTCYRKDNFVQHLVREHKLPEPRARTGRTRGDVTPVGEGTGWMPGNADPSDEVWSLVESCRHDTTKLPKDEPCRFCGNICNSWKKLTVHLAKHMEQISMPVLPLVEQKQIHADTIISPIDFPQPEKSNAILRSPGENPSRYNAATHGPALTANLDPSHAMGYPPSASLNTNLHSYPPPQAFNINPSPTTPGGPMDFSAPQANSYAFRSYPGVSIPPRQQQRTPYVNGGLQIPSGHVSGNSSPQQHGARFVPPITPVSAFENTAPVFASPDTANFPTAGVPSTGYPPTPQTGSSAVDGMPNFNEVSYGAPGRGQYPQNAEQYQQQINTYLQQQPPQQYPYQAQ